VNYDLTPYRILKVLAETFADLQESRIRIENRANNAPVLVEAFGLGWRIVPSKTGPKLQHIDSRSAEHAAQLALRRQFRKTAPAGLLAWQSDSKGIGLDILARLIGHLGHPRIATPSHWEGKGAERKLIPDEPYERTVSQLWQYCGHGSQDRPQKGMTAEDLFALGNPTLKMLTHVLAECSIKEPGRTVPDLGHISPDARRVNADVGSTLPAGQSGDDAQRRAASGDPLDLGQRCDEPHCGAAEVDPSDTARTNDVPAPIDVPSWPYRAVYEGRRIVTAERIHAHPCVRCGPSGRPAEAGSPWSLAHQHADALRIVGKEILRDIWKVSA
jgi:hypothetical protein